MRWEHTNVCAQLRIIIREATARHCKCDGKHTNVCAQCKLRIIIREVTAWPLQMRRETHQRLCAHWKLRIIIREATAWPLPMRREKKTPTCVPTGSSELLSEKQRHGRWKCDGKHTNVCAQFKLRIIIREVTAWPLQMRWEHQRVCPLQASNYYQRSNGMAVGNATGNTPTCVPNLSSES
jgi:hypothetical protein